MDYLTLSEYANLPAEDEAYLIDEFLPYRGRILLLGPQKVGKSFLALQIGLAIAKGEPFMGRPARAAKVLYLQYDTPHNIWRKRLHDIMRAGIEFPDNFYMVNVKNPAHKTKLDVLKNVEDVMYLQQVLEDVQPNLVIVDTLRKIYNGDENSSNVGKELFDTLNDVFKDQCVIFIHHTHKLSPPPGQKIQTRITPGDAGRGTSFFAGEVDAIYMLYGGRFSSECRFDESFDLRCDFDKITKQFSFPELATLPKMEASIRRIWNGTSWSSWADFHRHISHTIVDVPSHLMNRLEAELWQPS
jgi:hypothetical protein